MTVDWKRFAARVPAGIRVRSTDYDPLEDNLEINEGDEGCVTRHKRKANDRAIREYGRDQLYCKFDHLEDEWPMHPTCVQYLINDTWLTFQQVME